MKTQILLLTLLSIIFFASCSKTLLQKDAMLSLKQFADGIIEYSTEYSVAPGPWSSFVVLGAPDTYPEYGDIQTAWASRTSDGADEFLTVAFDTAQYVDQIEIYETYNPGAVTSIAARNVDNGSWTHIYEGHVEKDLAKRSRIMTIDIPETSFLVDAIRINISSRQVKGWNEIDAVSISGHHENE